MTSTETCRVAPAVVRLIVAAFVCSALAACQSSSGPKGPSANVVLTIGVPYQSAGTSQIVAFLNEEGLVRLGRDGRPQRLLAADWTVSSGGLTVTFALKRGVRFHDGSLLTPAHVKASLDRSRTIDQLHRRQYPLLSDIETIEAVGDDRLTIRLKSPSGLLVEALDVPITRTVGNRQVSPGPFFPVSSGPNASLRANPYYHRGRPTVDVVQFKTYDAVRPAWAAMMRGEIDFLYDVGPDSRPFVEEETSVRVFPYQRPFNAAIVPNLRRPVFRSAAVRRALNLAINRKEIIDRGLRGHGTASTGLWPRHWAYQGRVSDPVYDPMRAHALLSASGYRRDDVAPATGRMPSRLRFTCLVAPRFVAMERIALMVQHQLYIIGVDMQIEALPVEQLIRRVETGDFDAVLMDLYGGPGLSPSYFLWHSTAVRGFAGFGYSAADAALDRIRLGRDDAAVQAGADELRRVFAEDPPAIFIIWSEAARAVSRRFDVDVEPGRDVLGGVWRMQPAAGAAQP